MALSDPASTFSQNVEHYRTLAEKVSQRFNQFSTVRILTFLATLIGLVYLANARSDGGFWLLLVAFAVSFPLLIRYHNRLRARKDHLLALTTLNEHELKRLAFELADFDSGDNFQHPTHPYSGDLDVFGEHSLFQLINRSSTQQGKAKLAQWLLHPAAKEEVEERQTAVQELTGLTEWRQTFQAYGPCARRSDARRSDARRSDTQQPEQTESLTTLLNWMQEPPALLRRLLYTVLCYGLALLALTAIALYFTVSLPGYVVILSLAINGVVLWTTAEAASATHRKTTQSVAVLRAYQQMLTSIEQQAFISNRLQHLKANLRHDGVAASQEVSQLRYILDNFDARGNMFYHILNVVLMLDVFWLLRADRWKMQLRGDVARWFESISEMEALGGMASFAFAHPNFTFPTISHRRFQLQAQKMGHCLIPPQQRVANDFTMEDRGTITIITGSNMSGKSTFLRTVGVNVVLALAGAPVCAQAFEVSVMQVFTSMRTQDSLEENVSSFYAELRRLRQLLDMLKAPERPVLFMLDEILKGTNSQDRHHGAASLIKQLSQLEATGFVSTHDLELGALEATLPRVKNYSFTSTIEQDEIYFDYTLHEGVCKSFNASKLMAKMGIAVEE